MAVLAHQADFCALTMRAELLRGVDGEQPCFIQRPVGTVFAILVPDQPFVLDIVVDEEIAGCRHGLPRKAVWTSRPNVGPGVMFRKSPQVRCNLSSAEALLE